ncbi:MAG: uroporphyrinogen-III synthase [Porticoccus sp.]
MTALKGLRALLVRPEQSDDLFARQLVEAGATLYRYPVMLITPLAEVSEINQIKSHILNIDQYQIAIFISRTAAHLGTEWLARYWSVLPESLPQNLRYYAVGKSTAALLGEQGIDAEVPEQAFNSEGLLSLPSLNNIADEKALIFSGEGGRTLLADTLIQRGASVSECELYRREPTTEFSDQIVELLAAGALDLVIVHSGELLKNLLAIVPESQRSALVKLPLLVPSERVADIAKNSGFQAVICAGSALPEDMVSALRGWYSSSH